MRLALLPLCALCLSCVPLSRLQAEEPLPLAKVVLDLESNRFAVRQAALKEINKRGKEIIPSLLRMIEETKSQAIRDELTKYLQPIFWPTDEETGKKQVAKIDDYIKHGELDRYIEATIYWRDHFDAKTKRSQLVTVAQKMLELSKGKVKDDLNIRIASRELAQGREIKGIGVEHFCIAENIDPSGFHGFWFSEAIATKFLPCEKGVTNAHIFTNSDLKVHNVSSSVIFVNGNLTATHNICDSVVIVHGNVSVSSLSNSYVLASGTIDTRHGSDNSTLQEDQPTINTQFPIFNRQQLGCEFTDEKKRFDAIQYLTRHGDSWLAKSSFINGDRIHKVNLVKVESPAHLRLLLAKVSVVGSDAYFEVRRETNKLAFVHVQFPERLLKK